MNLPLDFDVLHQPKPSWTVESTGWISYGKTWREFTQDGLNNVGVQIEMEGCDELMLIGSINRVGGLCGCCSIYDQEIVTRFRILAVI